MMKRLSIVGLLFVCGLTAAAQQALYNYCPYYQHPDGLACLIGDLSRTGNPKATGLTAFDTTLAETLGQLPLAVPFSGVEITLGQAGTYELTYANLGSVMSERADTLGKNHLFVGFTYQRFGFQTIDGTKLRSLPTEGAVSSALLYADNHLTATVDQYMGVAAFGITNRLDLSVTVPVERVGLSGGDSGAFEASPSSCINTNQCFFSSGSAQFASGAASGVGDVILEVKGQVWNGERLRVAAGGEVRFPTGNEFNLLGSGAYGVKPYLTVSRHGRFTPHANLGFQWNGRSALYLANIAPPTAPAADWVHLQLPRSLEYSAGADFGIVRRITLVTDLLGQHFFNAPRVTSPQQVLDPSYMSGTQPYLLPNGQPVTSIGIRHADYDTDNLGLGLKVNPWKNLLVTGNVLFKLNEGGLRSKAVPLIGLSYRF